jgi:hypothetical protein
MSVLTALQRWYGRRNAGLIDVGEDGFDVYIRHKAGGMYWTDVVRIEAGRSPSQTGEIRYLQIFHANGQRLKLNDRMRGFKAFESAMLLHWPGARQAWAEVSSGPADEAEHRMLWVSLPGLS